MSRRLPAVAGQFYSATPDSLYAEVRKYIDPTAIRQPAAVVISPHAGLMYSGHVAGTVYSHAHLPDSIIMLGPNHTGLGPPVSVYPQGSWLIPGGEVGIDRTLAERILAKIKPAVADEVAHRSEHCLEVQLPFLLHLRPDLQIVPILLGINDQDVCREIGLRLAEVIEEQTHPEGDRAAPLLLATTDLSHYEPDHVTREKDAKAVEVIRRLDPESLHATVRSHNISMCGLGPTLSALHTARALHATNATLTRYATSGEVSGDLDRVVGYAGFVVPRPAPHKICVTNLTGPQDDGI